ncbi:hypothetical protein [Cellulomonas chengniuliangii]|uniref:hypothetical protein n=1 Tax=Cellulomonas chengniuliangii TaxID=2968084 RepID=UPI001D0F0A80|nr:hypothetical protein [Cellulomonas chengniuliangii]MCC2316939.1 hypothetical protein [Cellulomonas chengniuliangii]
MRLRILLPIIIAVAAALVIGGLVVASRNGDDPGAGSSQDSSSSPSPSATTPASPSATATPAATPPELPAGVPTEDQPNPAPTAPGAVEVTLTYAQWSASTTAVEVAGFAAVAPEPTGTCTVRLTRGAQEILASAPAVPDATTMTCGTISIPGSRASRGAWQATLTYESATGTGTSPQTTIEVP